MDKLAALLAKEEIREVLLRYARGVDRRDWESLRDCFHSDAVDRHGEFVGSPQRFIEWVTARHAPIPFSVHFLGNCLIEITGPETATGETYFIAMQRREGTSGQPETGTDYEVFGRYCDRFEARDGIWRIAERSVVYDGTRTLPSTHHLRSLQGIMGQRDGSDPVFGLRAAE